MKFYQKLLIAGTLLLGLGLLNQSYAGICTSEAIRVKHACTLDQFGHRCKDARANWRDCREIISKRAEESRHKELARKYRDYNERNERSFSKLIEFVFGVRL